MSKRFFGFLLLGGSVLCSRAAAQYTGVDLYALTPPAGTTAAGPTGMGMNSTDTGQFGGIATAGVVNQVADTHGVVWSAAGTPTDLNPTSAGYSYSTVQGIGGGQQVGFASGTVTGSNSNNSLPYNNHAMLWSGSAGSAVDLNPTGLTGFAESKAYATDGVHQVGEGLFTSSGGGIDEAMLWSGTAASAVNLQPTQFGNYNFSRAFAVSGNQQVGYMFTFIGGYSFKAVLWSGSAASAVNLDPVAIEKGPNGSEALGVGGGQQVGYALVSGNGLQTHAILWSGTAASAVDLNPASSTNSVAYSTNGTLQVGYVGVTPHATVWSGTAASAVDLNSQLPASFGASANSTATSVDGAGDVFGFAQDSGGQYHSVAWLAAPHVGTASVAGGSNQNATAAGRSASSGSVSVSFPSATGGTFSNTNSLTTSATLAGQTAPFNFALPTVDGLVQEWDLSFTGTFTSPATLTFHYDPATLAPGVDPSALTIEHFTNGQWVALSGVVDPVADTITVATNSFSPFALATVPEPAAATMFVVVAVGLIRRRY